MTRLEGSRNVPGENKPVAYMVIAKAVALETEELLSSIKQYNCLIDYTFGNLPVHVHREKSRKDTFEDASDRMHTVIPEGIKRHRR